VEQPHSDIRTRTKASDNSFFVVWLSFALFPVLLLLPVTILTLW